MRSMAAHEGVAAAHPGPAGDFKTSAKARQATMELYQREKVNPVAGCLPMLDPVPVFIAF